MASDTSGQQLGEEGGMQFLPKRMAVWIVPDEQADALVDAIASANAGGNYGDGKIFICPMEDQALEA